MISESTSGTEEEYIDFEPDWLDGQFSAAAKDVSELKSSNTKQPIGFNGTLINLDEYEESVACQHNFHTACRYVMCGCVCHSYH